MEMKDAPVMKYIVTNEYKPLHAMRKVFGPPNGPILIPIRVKIDIIGELLKQYDAPRLFEVIPIGTTAGGTLEYSEGVELTLENFRQSWYTIAGKEIPVVGLGEAVTPPASVEGDKAPVGGEDEGDKSEHQDSGTGEEVKTSEGDQAPDAGQTEDAPPVNEEEASKVETETPAEEPKVEAPAQKSGKPKNG